MIWMVVVFIAYLVFNIVYYGKSWVDERVPILFFSAIAAVLGGSLISVAIGFVLRTISEPYVAHNQPIYSISEQSDAEFVFGYNQNNCCFVTEDEHGRAYVSLKRDACFFEETAAQPYVEIYKKRCSGSGTYGSLSWWLYFPLPEEIMFSHVVFYIPENTRWESASGPFSRDVAYDLLND